MSGAVVKSDLAGLPAALSDLFKGAANESIGDLTQGVMAGFPTISYRGKVWRIRKGGEETNYVDANGDAVQSLEFVLAKANPVFAKVYYKAAFEEGATGKPDCWSADGLKPDANVLEPVCKTCAACPNNSWGSRISETGKKGKLCADRRRVAVVGPQDLADNGTECQKFLLHIPAGSLKGLSEYAEKVLKPKGIPYYAVVTRVGFDTTQAHPVLTFKATRYLTEVEARAILEIRESDDVARILQESHEFEGAASETAAAVEGIAGTMPGVLATSPTDVSAMTTGVAAPRPAATQVAPAAAPTPVQVVTPAAAPRTAVEAEIMPEKPKRTRKAAAKPADPAPVAVQPVVTPPPVAASKPPASDDFESMLDSILG
jgi:hypothetical protein